MLKKGSGCGSVASNTRGPQFESRHRQNLYWTFVYCIETTKIKEKRGREWPIKKKNAKECLKLKLLFNTEQKRIILHLTSINREEEKTTNTSKNLFHIFRLIYSVNSIDSISTTFKGWHFASCCCLSLAGSRCYIIHGYDMVRLG